MRYPICTRRVYQITYGGGYLGIGMKKFATTLKSFEIEFQPFVEEINAKEGAIRQCADAATMDRIRSMVPHNYSVRHNLMQGYRH